MKRKKIIEAMSLLDEKYISEADPFSPKSRFISIRMMAIAACLMLAFTALNLWLFLPSSLFMPSISKYKGSEYYEIIENVDAILKKKQPYKNNFDRIINTFGRFGSNSTRPAAGPAATSSSHRYSETTDNQVSGVIEADIIKRSDKYIYYMKEGYNYLKNNASGDIAELEIYETDGHACFKVGSYTFAAPENFVIMSSDVDFYLSEDCRTVTVIYAYTYILETDGARDHREKKYVSMTDVVSLDVSDPENIRLNKKISISGGVSRSISGGNPDSRMVGGKLLLISEFCFYDPDFSKPETYIPYMYVDGKCSFMSKEDIFVPDEVSVQRYTVVHKIDEATLDIEDGIAFFSYYPLSYVSADSVYLTYRHSGEDGYDVTDITRLRYTADTFENMGTVTVGGFAKDQYSFGEYEGVLRAVTTTRTGPLGTQTSASLWCIDAESMEIIASVENFAPEGEIVRSVRFDGDTAYVCTAIQAQDPVFFFDLSDLDNITYKDTGTIEGFSTSLINFGDGLLLGIGEGELYDTLKVEIYKESENGVVSVAKYEIYGASWSLDYKSYFVDRENRIFGFGATTNKNKDGRYILLGFDGCELYEVINCDIEGSDYSKRSVYLDGYFYIFSDEDLVVEKIG